MHFRLLHAQAAYCAFRGAAKTHELAVEMIEQLKNVGYYDSNHAALFAEFSVLFFIRSEYDQAYRYPFIQWLRSAENYCVTVIKFVNFIGICF